jgi:hypothetical protein
MTPKFFILTALAGAALVLAVPAQADDWGRDRQQTVVHVSPDLVDRAVAAELHRRGAMLDARERALGGDRSTALGAVEQRERAFGTKLQVQLAGGSSTDAFERAVASRPRTPDPIRDDRFRLDPSPGSEPVTVTDGREIEWPQVGIGFAIGMVLAIGLVLMLRATRQRPLAH